MKDKKEIRCGKIYAKDVFTKWFRVPEYQRPYSWGNGEINELMEDLTYASTQEADKDYYLGSFLYCTSKTEEKPEENNLLDGQQRLTTLFILFAVIRDLTDTPSLKVACQECIHQRENPYKNLPEITRIEYKVREDAEKFIEDFIKPEGGTLQIHNYTVEDISVHNMREAMLQMRDYLQENIPNFAKFFNFIMNKVVFIYVSTEGMHDAFRLFTIMNTRGMHLSNSDILKAMNLREVESEAERVRWAKLWEELEGVHLDNFDRFISWIRMILVKDKARLSLLKEFEQNIYQSDPPLLKKGRETFKLIENYHSCYQAVFSHNNYEQCGRTWAFDNLLGVMQAALPSTEWVPPLLAYFNKFEYDRLTIFLIKLDNKFSGDWIGGKTPTERIEAMSKIIEAIERAKSPLELFESEVFMVDRRKMFEIVKGEIYGRQFTKYLLLKLDHVFFDHSSGRLHTANCISIEHILPQQPEERSEWVEDFDPEQRSEMTHMLGNLILVGRRKNTALGRLDFDQKREKYFADSINTFPNSVRLLGVHNTWLPKDLLQNQELVMNKLRVHYGLGEIVS